MNDREEVLMKMIQDCGSIIELCSKISRKKTEPNQWDRNSLTKKLAFMMMTIEKLNDENLIDEKMLFDFVQEQEEIENV